MTPECVPNWELLFKELRAAVEECDQKAIKHEGGDGFIRSYLLTTGPWHRVLQKARQGLPLEYIPQGPWAGEGAEDSNVTPEHKETP